MTRRIAAFICVCVLFSGFGMPIMAQDTLPFSDVSEDMYYYDAVAWAYSAGIAAGRTTTVFSPNGGCTREQIVTFLWRAAGKPEPSSSRIPFSDVPQDRFTKAILWAYETGIVSGYADGTFRPDEICSRRHAVTFLWRYAGRPEAELSGELFSDISQDRFYDAIVWAAGEGIVDGYADGTFRGESTCTRAYIITFLYRMMVPSEPVIPEVWRANCNEYIALWSSASASSYSKLIMAGEEMTLLGWSGKFAHVSYKGKTGYVYAGYVQPAEDPELTGFLELVEPVESYSYESMMSDLQALCEKKPCLASMEIIGTSELGVEIPVIRIGNEDARYHVLLQGAIHGREHMTAWLLTALAEYYVTYGIGDHGDICYHIIPMSNPDGVYISQTGTLSEEQLKIYYRDYKNGYTEENYAMYARRWKANGLGVDLNRNFPAGWKRTGGRSTYSSELYKGEYAFCAAETIALRDYTLCYDFDVTISYHASGSLIYYEYGKNAETNASSKSLAQAVRTVTGYPLEDSGGVDAAGYKDWVIDELGIPSLTIEIGCWEAPLALKECYSTFIRNLEVLPAVARWLQDQA